VIDVTDLRFIDISGMRAIAHGARAAGDAIRLQGASADLLRLWDICGFKDFAPEVQLGLLPAPARVLNPSREWPAIPSGRDPCHQAGANRNPAKPPATRAVQPRHPSMIPGPLRP
jgi:hypothetical protein